MSFDSRLGSSESGSSESPIPGGSGTVESEQARDSECSLRSESSLPPGITRGYNSEDYYRGKLQFDRFAINHVPKNLINHSKLILYREEFSIPPEVGLRIPNEGERAINPEPGSAAFHPSFMELGVRLPLQSYLRRFLRDIGLAGGGDGWWYLASWTKQAGKGLITGLPTSNKEWKKTWFIATEWGRELSLGGRPIRVRLVFGFPGQ
ncbi:hypothetical protein ACOSQ3_016427 [Xanthoceras sorbifolium]